MLQGKRIVLGVTGSIAAYKAADVASKLTQAGALVDVLLTPSAVQFVTPLTFRSLTGRPVYTDMFNPDTEVAEQHVFLARQADAVLVAPATATTIARLAAGLADDMVSLTVLATRAPVLLAPAMDAQMWENPATQANVETLTQRGMIFVGPAEGRLASGLSGRGRLVDTDTLLGALRQALGRGGDFAGRRIVITAGPTQEPIDPVRYVSNHSSGKQGYALAEAARDRGADVVLITGPVALPVPYGVRAVPVVRAGEMLDAVDREIGAADALIMAAAVADFRPASEAAHKIKKREDGAAMMSLELERVPDAWPRWAEAAPGCLRVGFAAETRDLEGYARQKLEGGRMHLIVANDVTASDAGFSVDTNRVVIIDAAGRVERLPLLSKLEVAHRVLDRVRDLLAAPP